MHAMEKRLLIGMKECVQGSSASDSNKNQGDTSDDTSNLKFQAATSDGTSNLKVQADTGGTSDLKCQTITSHDATAKPMTEMVEPMTEMVEPTTEIQKDQESDVEIQKDQEDDVGVSGGSEIQKEQEDDEEMLSGCEEGAAESEADSDEEGTAESELDPDWVAATVEGRFNSKSWAQWFDKGLELQERTWENEDQLIDFDKYLELQRQTRDNNIQFLRRSWSIGIDHTNGFSPDARKMVKPFPDWESKMFWGNGTPPAYFGDDVPARLTEAQMQAYYLLVPEEEEEEDEEEDSESESKSESE